MAFLRIAEVTETISELTRCIIETCMGGFGGSRMGAEMPLEPGAQLERRCEALEAGREPPPSRRYGATAIGPPVVGILLAVFLVNTDSRVGSRNKLCVFPALREAPPNV